MIKGSNKIIFHSSLQLGRTENHHLVHVINLFLKNQSYVLEEPLKNAQKISETWTLKENSQLFLSATKPRTPVVSVGLQKNKLVWKISVNLIMS